VRAVRSRHTALFGGSDPRVRLFEHHASQVKPRSGCRAPPSFGVLRCSSFKRGQKGDCLKDEEKHFSSFRKGGGLGELARYSAGETLRRPPTLQYGRVHPPSTERPVLMVPGSSGSTPAVGRGFRRRGGKYTAPRMADDERLDRAPWWLPPSESPEEHGLPPP